MQHALSAVPWSQLHGSGNQGLAASFSLILLTDLNWTSSPNSTMRRRGAVQQWCHHILLIWEFPQIGGPKTDPNILCSLLSGLPNKALDFWNPPHMRFFSSAVQPSARDDRYTAAFGETRCMTLTGSCPTPQTAKGCLLILNSFRFFGKMTNASTLEQA